jgi:serine/threonine-protein kinase HipA
MADAQRLTIQVHVDDRWLDAGEIAFRWPGNGLRSQMSFYYRPEYVVEVAGDACLSEACFTDHRAVTVNAPASLTGHYDETVIAPFLRDIIPQGFARQVLTKRTGNSRVRGAGQDFALLRDFCVSPIGNVRVKEAVDRFCKTLDKQPVQSLRADDLLRSPTALFDVINSTPTDFLAGALGAGGEAPKLLMVEDQAGELYLKGTLSPGHVRKHWLVKFPRGRMTENDRNILRSESVFYEALAKCGINTLHGTKFLEGNIPSLWLPRFDRPMTESDEHRVGVESMYCLNKMVGNGARMHHETVLTALRRSIYDNDHYDQNLCDYLIRDVVNAATGNTDNHGRNASIIKTERGIKLSPAYDIAPMVMDDDGIAVATVWSGKYGTRNEDPDYSAIVEEFAVDASVVISDFRAKLSQLCQLNEVARALGLPGSAFQHFRIDLTRPQRVLKHVSSAHD